MAYLYETHLHSCRASACAISSGPEYIRGYLELGYDGIFVTDHFYLGNTCIPRKLKWHDWVNRYCFSYEETKLAGEKQGLKVFFGWETSYGTGEDFLIYGLDADWLKRHPELICLKQEEQFSLIDEEGGLVVQAHPFRERGYMREIQLHPNHSHAWEIYNAGNEPYMDTNARIFAEDRNLICTCGSDIHSCAQLQAGHVYAMATDNPLNCEADYVALIKSGRGFSLIIPETLKKARSKPPELPVYLWE